MKYLQKSVTCSKSVVYVSKVNIYANKHASAIREESQSKGLVMLCCPDIFFLIFKCSVYFNFCSVYFNDFNF